eukprot:1183300-Prorocentrum_minimum.AAC.1
MTTSNHPRLQKIACGRAVTISHIGAISLCECVRLQKIACGRAVTFGHIQSRLTTVISACGCRRSPAAEQSHSVRSPVPSDHSD